MKGQICAEYLEGGIDACLGDTELLVVDNKLAGIVSWGIALDLSFLVFILMFRIIVIERAELLEPISNFKL